MFWHERKIILLAGVVTGIFSSVLCSAAPINPESTELNQFFYNLANGVYVSGAVNEFLEETVPFWDVLPIEFAPIEDEIQRVVRRETVKGAKQLFSEGVGSLGLQGSLSLGSGAPSSQASNPRRQSRPPQNSVRVKLHASFSRLALSLYWKF
ncbi:MAG: hypothetical protein HY547_08665 [Elusimicrobia bacterium]|nr:hypothetical protein [Elusimicrobiota bacterium]